MGRERRWCVVWNWGQRDFRIIGPYTEAEALQAHGQMATSLDALGGAGTLDITPMLSLTDARAYLEPTR